jgi:ATP-binding cassette subfamily B protein/subfamily B ATP-binding cassette protein MsbA
VFRGDSLHEWLDEKTAEAQREARELGSRLEQSRAESAADVDLLQTRLRHQQDVAASLQRLQAFAHRYLPHDAVHNLLVLLGLLMAVVLLKGLFLLVNLLLVERLTQETLLHLRLGLYEHTLGLELAAFSKERTGELMSRFTYDLNIVTSGLSTLFGKSIREPFKMLACLAGAAFISWQLLVVSLVLASLGVLVTYSMAKLIKRANRRVMEAGAGLYHRLTESFRGIHVVKAFTMEPAEAERTRTASRRVYRTTMWATVWGAVTRLNIELFGMGVICLSILAGGYLVLTGSTQVLGIPLAAHPLSFGTMILFYAFLIGASDPARKLAHVFTHLQSAAAASERIYALWDRRPRVFDPPRPVPLDDANCDLVFHDVHFSYEPGQPVLSEIDLRIRAGETLAIVGPNGCGKTTLAKLVPRFFDPDHGEIRLGETDLRQLRQADLRGRIGIVTQDPLLFDDSVMNNIRYGSPDAGPQDVERAARLAQAHRFIVDDLEHGYDTHVGEHGCRLSGGQRQRVALARAVLRDPELLIFDEATSQIDPESESLLHGSLRTFLRDRTAIIITHRVSTLALADRILVMQAGRVVDLGPHDVLLARCDLYARMHRDERKASA